MKLSRNNRIAINFVIIGMSILVWVLLLVNPGHIMTMEHCHVSDSCSSGVSNEMLLKMNPISMQLLGWGLMVVAMMQTKLILPIQLIYMQSFKRYRFFHSFLFVLGYITAWMIAGILMIAVIIELNVLMPISYIPALGVLLIAVIWQFSPIKQRFLNLGGDHRMLPAFGWIASRDALYFGIMHGLWCIGSGWALMLFPMLLPEGHILAMLIVTFIMLSEHLEHPRFPQWNLNFRLKLFKIIIAQTKIRLMPSK